MCETVEDPCVPPLCLRCGVVVEIGHDRSRATLPVLMIELASRAQHVSCCSAKLASVRDWLAMLAPAEKKVIRLSGSRAALFMRSFQAQSIEKVCTAVDQCSRAV